MTSEYRANSSPRIRTDRKVIAGPAPVHRADPPNYHTFRLLRSREVVKPPAMLLDAEPLSATGADPILRNQPFDPKELRSGEAASRCGGDIMLRAQRSAR